MEIPRNTVPSASTSTAGWCCGTRTLRICIEGARTAPGYAKRDGLSAHPACTNCVKLYRNPGPDSTQAEHILHVIQPGTPPGKEARGTQGTERKSGTAAGLVGNFHTLANSGKQNGVVAHDVATTHCGKANGG